MEALVETKTTAPRGRPTTTRRPTLKHSSLNGGSYLNDHQQYKPIQSDNSATIDGVLESHNPVPQAQYLSLNGVPLSPSPTRIKESSIVHALSHDSCQPLPSDPAKLVATIFYKSASPVHPHLHPDTSPHPKSTSRLPTPIVAAGSAPSLDLDKYPLEPPAPEPEPLDHLYGAHVSQLCLTHFLSILDSLQKPYARITSSHRCLDSQTHPRVVEVTFSPAPDPTYLTFSDLCKHEAIYRFEREWNVEVVLQHESIYRRHKRLAVFDMDSTLIQQEVIDEIARTIGIEKEVSAITARAMNGELDFAASLKARVALLKGVPADVFDRLKPTITITPGARELCRALKRLGYTLAVVSGGFQPLANWLQQQLGLDYAFANHLETDPTTSTLTGTLSPDNPIVDASYKRHMLETLAEKHYIPIKQTLAVGDGANDLPMLLRAGLGIAWNAKSMVQMEAPGRLNGEKLSDILFLLGLPQGEISELLEASG